MRNPQLDAFTARLAGDGLREADAAVGLIWFLTHGMEHTADATAKELADVMVAQRLSGKVNASRLGINLAKHPSVVRGQRPGSFRIRSSSDATLTAIYRDHADLSNAPVKDGLISASISLGGRKNLDAVRREANGSYERAFYNSSAVMCRRLTEMLLIEAFDKCGRLDDVRDSQGNLQPFSELIAAAKSGRLLRLSRTAPSALVKVKQLGDGAAHHRHFLVAKKDLDDLNPGLALLLSELAALAGL
ncbi:hypothetical protein [Brevundimonas sp.]|uniref:hypothetical protein n=1 Tax=Brevundimonas sp. TaxID=1871086 RepID=UPI0035620CD6